MSVPIGGFTRRQPKNLRTRRALRKFEPHVVENPKTILFLRGSSTSEAVTSAMHDLWAICSPFTKRLAKRNTFHPFDGEAHLGFLGYKNDCSLFCFGSDSKKRPHNVVLGRHFDFHVLDMFEFGIVAQDRIDMSPVEGLGVGALATRPVFVFDGGEFVSDELFVRLKNFLIDFFRGGNETKVAVDGIERVVHVSLRSADGEAAVRPPSLDGGASKPPTDAGNVVVCLRHYAMRKTTSWVRSPTTSANVALFDVGPNLDLALRRVRIAPMADFKAATRVPREALAHQRSMHEGVTKDGLDALRGQIHVGSQDLASLKLTRSKALRRRARAAPLGGGGDDDGEAAEGGAAPPRRRRRSSAAQPPAPASLTTDI